MAALALGEIDEFVRPHPHRPGQHHRKGHKSIHHPPQSAPPSNQAKLHQDLALQRPLHQPKLDPLAS